MNARERAGWAVHRAAVRAVRAALGVLDVVDRALPCRFANTTHLDHHTERTTP